MNKMFSREEMNKRFSKAKVTDYLEVSNDNARSRFDLATEGLPHAIKLKLEIEPLHSHEVYDILSVQMDLGNITGAQMLEAAAMLDRMLYTEVTSETLKLVSHNYF
tara:strand:+ start:2317 stop:2634 length:318 start_codon:yes stop_codon:yes gene_type:complete